ncbi:MAG: Mut7-C ubiquitin/RNAse domain-containing protein [Gemmatimonadetes bacterium]|jgi:uncharacterized protein|nr:Mut7-C ubiquitin/RNAse domain-containing protein [Gemmatimonadota bacterium]
MEHTPERRVAEFRFYEELNDFLPLARRKRAFQHEFAGTPSVKDTIEALGVSHTEVDLILVGGKSVGFDSLLVGGERVAVYPVFEALDISPLTHLRPHPLRRTRFILDVHLGKLARYLRLLGFDSLYRNDFDDAEIVAISLSERRIILTRDKGILKTGAVTHGYWLREVRPKAQLREVVKALDLGRSTKPFTRCMVCNVELSRVEKREIVDQLPERVRENQDTFARCSGCHRIFWAGSHYERLQELVQELIPDSD